MKILQGDCLTVLKTVPERSVQMCVTSPPYYGLRDYGVDGQIGLEDTPEQFIQRLVDVFREVRRVLKDDGTLWVNIGDSYAAQRGGTTPPAETLAGGEHGKTPDGENVNRGRKDGYNPSRNASAIGLKHKDLIGIPWMLAFALRADGWFLRQDIIWQKPNPMPESVTDRCTKSHEYIFLLSKYPKYYFDHEAIQEEAKQEWLGRYKYGFFNGKEQENFRPDGASNTAGIKKPQTKRKNLQENGQQNHSMHERRAHGLPDEQYAVRNKRDVWTVTTKPFTGAHFATFPEELIRPCILAGSREGDLVLDPFNGAATTGVVCKRTKRDYLGIELNPEYVKISNERLQRVDAEIYMEQNQFSFFEEDTK